MKKNAVENVTENKVGNICEQCGESLEDNSVDLKPHKFDNEKEEYYRVCCNCGNRILEIRELTVHAEDRFMVNPKNGRLIDMNSFNYEDYKCDFSNLEE